MNNILALLAFLPILSTWAADPLESNQWYLNYDAKTKGANIKKAWEVVESNYQPIIAVIDAGFDITHEDLRDSILINDKEIPNNGIDDDNNGFIDDYYGLNTDKENGDVTGKFDFHTKHGTAVAGVISSKHDNDLGIKGVSNGFKIIPIVKPDPMARRVEKLPNLIRGLRYAIERGADIINFSARLKVTSPELKEVLQELNDKGILIIASAGNTGTLNALDRYPGAYSEEFSNIIVVGSTDRDGNKAASSCFGKKAVHLFAPGVEIQTTIPNNSYNFSSGTSYAAPVVAAIAALVLATHGPESKWQMRQRLIQTSNKIEELEGFSLSEGIVDAYRAITDF